MRIVVWGINYAPEVTGIAPYNTGLCRFLASQGHDVHMVTTFSYYPQWRKSKDDAGRLYREDADGKVAVHRCWHYVPPRPSTLQRIAHEFTFGLTSLTRVLTLPRADAYIIISPPLIVGPLAWLATTLKNSHYLFHVQDLQPDAALGLGMVKPGLFTKALYAIEAFAYHHAALVSGISQGMLDAFTNKGVPKSKQWYFPNWIQDEKALVAQPHGAVEFRVKQGIAPDAFLAVYSGNLGNKQGLGVLLETAAILARDAATAARPIEIIIAGDGAARAMLTARHAELGLRNVRLLPLLNDHDYRAMLRTADVALITQEKGTGQFFFPSKMLTVLGAGLAVVAVADDDSELAHALARNHCGFVVPPGEPEKLATCLRTLAGTPPRELEAMCQRGQAFVATFAARFVLPAFLTRLKLLLKDVEGPPVPII